MRAAIASVSAARSRSSSPAAETPGSRRAALLLHAMAEADRIWLLDAMPASERDRLAPLLVELETLGIARDPRLIDAATSAPAGDRGGHAGPPDSHAPKSMPAPADLAKLDHRQRQAMHRRLCNEPPRLLAIWLRIAPKETHAELLDLLNAAQRRRVERCQATALPATPPALRAALISALTNPPEPQPADVHARSPLHRLWQRLRPQRLRPHLLPGAGR